MNDLSAATSAPSEEAQRLNQEALRALATRDFAAARQSLRQAIKLSAKEPTLWLSLALCEREAGNGEAALEAVEGALAIDARHFSALLLKAALMERLGRMRQAANAYGVALTQAPPDHRLDAPTLRAVRHARAVHGQHLADLQDFIVSETREALAQAPADEARRLAAFRDLLVGRRRNFRQQPTEFFYPGLPAIEFYERSHFPWLADLEAQTAAIREELDGVMASAAERFTPYIRYTEKVPLDQWEELNHSPRWSAFHLIEYGARNAPNADRCPKTMEAIAAIPQPAIPARSPAAMFSYLQPKTRIPPHTGVANVRLVMHLPLIVPPACGFRVGNETREWKVGQGWVFDDTIEHEAWNESDQVRVILICDVWSPFLSEAERAGIVALMAAVDTFNEAPPAGGL